MKNAAKKSCPVCHGPLPKGGDPNFCGEECRDEYVAYESQVLDVKDEFGWARTVIPPGR